MRAYWPLFTGLAIGGLVFAATLSGSHTALHIGTWDLGPGSLSAFSWALVAFFAASGLTAAINIGLSILDALTEIRNLQRPAESLD